MQVRREVHMRLSIDVKEQFEIGKRSLDEDMKRFFKLFTESTFEGSQAAAREMREIARRQTKHNQKFLMFHSLLFLVRFSDSKMLSWPNSPLLVMLEFVDPNSFLAVLRTSVEYFSALILRPDNPDRVQNKFLLHQWRDIEEILMARDP
jgi:hypothetical protein